MQRWVELDDGDAKLGAVLAGLAAPAETRKRVGDLRTTQQVMRIQQVSTLCFSTSSASLHGNAPLAQVAHKLPARDPLLHLTHETSLSGHGPALLT